jgi:hypothetical protein
MSDLTPASVLATLARISKDIETQTRLLRTMDEEETRTRHAHRRAFNVGLYVNKLDEEGKAYTADIRRALAQDGAQELEVEWEAARINFQEIKDELKMLRDRLDVGRSLSPIMRLEYGQSS